MLRRYTDLSRKPISPKARFLPGGGQRRAGCSVTLPLNIYFQLDRAVVGAEHLSMYIGGHKLAVERL